MSSTRPLSDTDQQANLNIHAASTRHPHAFHSRKVIVLVSLIAVCAIILAVYAFEQKREARRQANLASQKTREALQQEKYALEQRINADSNREHALLQRE